MSNKNDFNQANFKFLSLSKVLLKMASFEIFNLRKQLNNAINDLGFNSPTSIQEQAFNVVLSGKDVLGIAQTGTGKTLAYMMPILEELKFSNQIPPRVLILVPTRELVTQVVDDISNLTKYMSVRTIGVFGGVNIKTQKAAIAEGADIIVATPGRLYDLVLHQALSMKEIKKLVIDEVDVMLDLGFIHQLTGIFELIPARRQNILFSATMTDEVESLIDDFFVAPVKISIAVSGTPLENIRQSCFEVPNFYSKVNLVKHLLSDREAFKKVLIFVSNKRLADQLFNELQEDFGTESCLIHSNKTQNYRFRSIEEFDSGKHRILVATDIIARGLDLDKISHVINFDTPIFPENYMHRIGRTGRAEEEGRSILFYTEKEEKYKEAIEQLMNYSIPLEKCPKGVSYTDKLLPEEKPADPLMKDLTRVKKNENAGDAYHERKEKNKKVNLGGSYKREIAKKYKKAQTRGDKTYHKKQKKG